MSELLSVSNLKVQFRSRDTVATAVDDMSLVVNKGECVGLVGESGCGKTTTGLAIMRLLPGTGKIVGGNVVLDGVDLASLSEKEMQRQRGRSIALVPQDPMSSLNPTTKIGRQIGEGMRIHFGVGEEEARKRALEVLEMVEMPRPSERLDQYPFELSGGLRQRVIIAMGLVCSPTLLIADEPTTALDVTIQAQILDILDNLRKDLGMAMLLITHDMGVIAGRADRVVVMYAGKKAEEASTFDLFNSMRHPYTQALLASMPNLENTTKHRLASIAGMPPALTKEIVACRFAPRCAYATDQCRSEDPPMTLEGGHAFACFHPTDGPLPVVLVAASPATSVTSAATSGVTKTELVRAVGLVKEFEVKGGLIRHKVGAIHAVSNVSFSLTEGETFGLVGESGCGKTTIGRMLVGLEPLTSGEIFFDNKLVSARGHKPSRADRRDRQMMFQDPYSSLDPRMKVAQIIGEPLAVQGDGDKVQQRDRVYELLASVGLDRGAADRYPHEFSGGQRQRIGFARALALNPRLIVADEPVSALDVSVQAQILNLMKELQREHRLSYVMVSHDLAVIYYMADTIAVMYLGKIVELGDAESVFRSPAHPYTQGLLDAVPVPDPARARQRRGFQVHGELPSALHPPSGCRFRTRCPKAQELCSVEEPLLRSFAATQEAACHFPLKTPVTVGSKI
ncbi:MAG: oligopeptide/dipeptide transporter, ATPase subunit [Acidimicrobiaceae bacterium]|nr:oligopeptide/dipeptide transporter, ATPase subunit [Acidimicrobiaceae bacterium]